MDSPSECDFFLLVDVGAGESCSLTLQGGDGRGQSSVSSTGELDK